MLVFAVFKNKITIELRTQKVREFSKLAISTNNYYRAIIPKPISVLVTMNEPAMYTCTIHSLLFMCVRA